MRREAQSWVMAVVLGFALVGCATNGPLDFNTRSHSNGEDVFGSHRGRGGPERVRRSGNPCIDQDPSGRVLSLRATGFRPGKTGLPFLLNVDGQAVTWKVDGHPETTPRYFEDGTRNPEGGTGIRYLLDRRIRLQPGIHHLFFGLPGEDFFWNSM